MNHWQLGVYRDRKGIPGIVEFILRFTAVVFARVVRMSGRDSMVKIRTTIPVMCPYDATMLVRGDLLAHDHTVCRKLKGPRRRRSLSTSPVEISAHGIKTVQI